ncbi:efflux RND transporter periplasmic adaptor subunit [Afipia sp. OHSU_I-C6]|jgi:cobalt-zinc-cadmium efflux system membrane fusion protein|uniref:efflux RND transporter periplasmic adaptor subunit n=2 Tax=Afipia TaxID=1033 RepID=UPI00041E724A|nr:efflux RND transporter periplasmic adaptor subunit [Afipia sp. OHSU_I-C6]WIG53883.1 MAG: CzcABC family efflux RND transporter, membrane fusion protein [Afipia sp.]
MMSRSTIVALAFAAGAAIVALTPGLSTIAQRAVGTGPQSKIAISPKPSAPEPISGLLSMSDEQIKLAQIDLVDVGPAAIARRLVVPGSVVPDANLIAHVSVKLSGTVAELRKNIGEDVAKDEVIAVLESREVADAKSEYLAAKLTNDLQQDLSTRDKTLWDSRVGTEQQYLRSRNAAAQTEMRVKIARQKLLALGLGEREITAVPGAPEASLRRQDVRSPISGRVAERKVELGTAVGRDSLETELFVVVDLSRVWVELSVASSDLPLIKEGQSVKIFARGLAETSSGKIVFVSPLIDKDTRTARVVAEIPNPDRTWRPGSFVTAGIVLNERTVPVTVPATAIQKLDGQSIVFVRTKDGFEKRNVVLGESEDQTLEIVSGLNPGESIAATNTFPLKAELSKPRDED